MALAIQLAALHGTVAVYRAPGQAAGCGRFAPSPLVWAGDMFVTEASPVGSARLKVLYGNPQALRLLWQ